MFKKKERFIGIDISPSSVKLIELSRNGKRYQVEAMAIEPLVDDAMQDRNPSDMDKVGNAIKRALKNSGSSLKKAAVAVPTSSVITRTIPMPLDFGEDEIENNIQLEASQYIPFPFDEVYLDFQVEGASRSSASTQDVTIVASRRENIDLRDEILKDAGLKASVVDVEAYAIENTFSLLLASNSKSELATPDDEQPLTQIAVVDIGASYTTLYVFQSHVTQNDRVIFTREHNFGGDQLTTAISETYNLSKDRAEQAKRSGELSEDYITTILEPYRRSVAEQISNGLQFFFSSTEHSTIDQIILAGGGAMVQGLDKTISDLLNIPTTVSNPFSDMGSAKRVNRRSLLRDAPLFTVACGLALRSFD